jgi:hypothetical protein
MTECRLIAGTIVVVEEDELLGEGVMIRGDVPPDSTSDGSPLPWGMSPNS